MNIDITPVDEKGKKRYKLKVDGEDVLPPIGKTGLRIRINELIHRNVPDRGG